MVSLLGGAELERYLLAGDSAGLHRDGRGMVRAVSVAHARVSIVAVSPGCLLGLFLNPPFPFPYENNLAHGGFRPDLQRPQRSSWRGPIRARPFTRRGR